ncbi:metal ABC transporter permease [Allochromatium vinosum]|uniref:ABC-3 protein n=1 Tax=Allochromatium vinosum (strain ATCC 17899 / DSM 180 / NBRC 103801 / NCIMB 10441 / D) TaxID=572477 RepID=D3RTI7_ALLVD|nr:metal ABC transporter permease [Allochromatium vinosum]ADC62496.1 ABC-3 protein [Allochromatium vinosum DSM 180]MBK1653100.1 metal ABC transporter permease [Allochromatium vinosum]
MAEFLTALGTYGFLQSALIAGLLASVGCGVIGTFVVVKRIAFMAGGIAHSVLGGMGAALYFGVDPFAGALIAAILSALLIGAVRLSWKTQEDTLIGALWAIGMAVGVLFIAKTPGYSSDLMSFLFGNILLVPTRELWWMAGLDLVLVATVALFYRQFLAVTFDEEFARLRGVPVTLFYLLLLCLVAVTVVLLIQVVGLILVIALLTLPAAIAGHYVHSLGAMMLIATGLGALFTTLGLALSFGPDLPAGPTMILLAGGVYILSALISRQLHRRRAWRQATAVRG